MPTLDEVKELLLSTDGAKSTYVEAKARRILADNIGIFSKRCGFSEEDFCNVLDVSKSQVEMLLNKRRGGNLYLSTIAKASIILNTPIFDLFVEWTKEDE